MKQQPNALHKAATHFRYVASLHKGSEQHKLEFRSEHFETQRVLHPTGIIYRVK